MRRSPGQVFSLPLLILCLVLVFTQGCARSILRTYPAGALEIAATTEAFARFQELSRKACPESFDAEADAAFSVSGWFSDHTVKFSGYLQAMQPGYVKFVAINPLGQPLYIFSTDGNTFTGIDVFAEKAYTGSTRSEPYRRFAPQTFVPELSYYWLTGRLQPGDLQIREVMRAAEQGRFWLQINRTDASTDSMVLFDPEDLVILRHIIRDESGVHLVDILYGDHRILPGTAAGIFAAGAGGSTDGTDNGREFCKVPASISVFSLADDARLEVKLAAFLENPDLSPEDFRLDIPGNFEQELVR